MDSEQTYYQIQKDDVKPMISAIDKLNRAIRILDVLDTNLCNTGHPGQAEISGIILNELRGAKGRFEEVRSRLQVAISIADSDKQTSQSYE